MDLLFQPVRFLYFFYCTILLKTYFFLIIFLKLPFVRIDLFHNINQWLNIYSYSFLSLTPKGHFRIMQEIDHLTKKGENAYEDK